MSVIDVELVAVAIVGENCEAFHNGNAMSKAFKVPFPWLQMQILCHSQWKHGTGIFVFVRSGPLDPEFWQCHVWSFSQSQMPPSKLVLSYSLKNEEGWSKYPQIRMHWCSTSKEQCTKKDTVGDKHLRWLQICHLQQTGVGQTHLIGDHCGQFFIGKPIPLSALTVSCGCKKGCLGIANAKKGLLIVHSIVSMMWRRLVRRQWRLKNTFIVIINQSISQSIKQKPCMKHEINTSVRGFICVIVFL